MKSIRLGPIKIAGDWKHILKNSASIKVLIVAIVLTGIEAVLTLFGAGLPFPGWLKALLNFLVVGLAFGARLLAQSTFGDD